jgi:hypothetical protein
MAVLVAGALFAGIVGGTVLAQENDDGSTNPVSSLIAKVAAKLGIGEQELKTAVDEAREELADERLQSQLDKLVANGVLTQEQADEYKLWLDAAPDGLPGGFGQRGFGFGDGRGSFFFRSFGGRGFGFRFERHGFGHGGGGSGETDSGSAEGASL